MATTRMVRVAQDGSGDYCSVQDAIDSVPLGNTCRTVIRLSPGIYRQPVYVPKRKNFITFAGISPEITVLTWNNTASTIEHHQVTLLFLGIWYVYGSDWVIGWIFFCFCRRLESLGLVRLGVGVLLLKVKILLQRTLRLRILLLR